MLKDSGNRTVFDTGAQRDLQHGKGSFELLPFIAIWELSKHFEDGANKYAPHNWRKGIPYSKFFNSAIRHLFKWMMGFDDEPHLRAAAWNVLCLLETMRMVELGRLPSELDDRWPGYIQMWESIMAMFERDLNDA